MMLLQAEQDSRGVQGVRLCSHSLQVAPQGRIVLAGCPSSDPGLSCQLWPQEQGCCKASKVLLSGNHSQASTVYAFTKQARGASQSSGCKPVLAAGLHGQGVRFEGLAPSPGLPLSSHCMLMRAELHRE